MTNRPVFARISRFFKALYLKLFRINDTPYRIASGFALGVFLGVLPGTGPIAALALAFLLKMNRASALLGSVLTNTWLSIPVFLMSLKAGSYLTGVSYQDLNRDWTLLVKEFRWSALLDLGVYNVLMPILVGYVAVSLAIGMIVYLAALVIVRYVKRKV